MRRTGLGMSVIEELHGGALNPFAGASSSHGGAIYQRSGSGYQTVYYQPIRPQPTPQGTGQGSRDASGEAFTPIAAVTLNPQLPASNQAQATSKNKSFEFTSSHFALLLLLVWIAGK